MEPGPVLAGFAADAWDKGVAALTDDELIGVMGAARRITSWASALELTAVAGLDSRRAAWAAATGDSRQAEHVGDEVAAALTLTCRAADKLVSLAAGVMRLPAAAAALTAGRIDLPRAIVFTRELAGLDDVAAAAVAALVAPDAPGLTTSRLGQVLHRAVLALDPDAACKRREKAQKDARVECWTEPSGTWSLAGRDLPRPRPSPPTSTSTPPPATSRPPAPAEPCSSSAPGCSSPCWLAGRCTRCCPARTSPRTARTGHPTAATPKETGPARPTTRTTGIVSGPVTAQTAAAGLAEAARTTATPATARETTGTTQMAAAPAGQDPAPGTGRAARAAGWRSRPGCPGQST
jgi:hypothetical protein